MVLDILDMSFSSLPLYLAGSKQMPLLLKVLPVNTELFLAPFLAFVFAPGGFRLWALETI